MSDDLRFYIGSPLWGYKEWVGDFFPPRTPASEFLRLYSRRLTCVEGNTTFYATPSVATIARWVQETPETFRICPKISRSISHEPLLQESRLATLQFVERLRGLGKRLGPMFLQLPPAFSPAQMGELEEFLGFWPNDVRLAVEVRHPDFFVEEHAAALNTLLSQYRAARVLMDTRPIRTGPMNEQQMLQARERKPDLPLQFALTSDFTFVRYIGHPRMEINEQFLNEWVQHLGQWLQDGITLYVFCHCPLEEYSPGLCAELYGRVMKKVPLPPLPWQHERQATEPEQGRLF